MTDRRISVLCWSGLAVFTLYLLWVNHDYYQADTQIPAYDEAWYLETSLGLYGRLTREGLAGFWDGYRRAFGVKAPLLSVLPVPFYLLFGPSRESAMLVNSGFIIFSNLFLFLLARRWFSPSAGLAAAVFYQTMPLAFGLSRAFMAEYALAALVILFLYVLAASDRLTRPRETFLLGVLLGFGLLLKILFLAFVAGPLALYLIQRRSWRPLVAISVPALAIASTWYAYNLRSVLDFAWRSAYGQLAADYAAGGLGPWLLLLVNQGTSFYYAAALVVLGPAALLGRRRSRSSPSSERPLWFLLAWFVPPVLALLAGRNQLLRFALPVLPVPALALGAAVFSLGRRWTLQAALALGLAVFPYRLFAALTYRAHEPASHALTVGPFVLFARELGWARPPVHEHPWDHRRLLEAVHRLAPDAGTPYYAVLALDHAYLNANLLNYLNAYQNYPVRFTSLGYAETSLDRALDRLYNLEARFLILGEGFRGLPPFLNRLNDELRSRLERGNLPFRLCAEIPLSPPHKALLYERDAPWTIAGHAAPAHPHAADFPGGLRFLGYDLRRRDAWLGELTCYWTTREPLRQQYRVRLDFPDRARSLDFLITGGRLPPAEWRPGDIVRETRYIYLGPSGSAPVEARLTLTPWGVGPPVGPMIPLRLSE